MRGRGASVAGETATEADGTHPTGMHSCYLECSHVRFLLSSQVTLFPSSFPCFSLFTFGFAFIPLDMFSASRIVGNSSSVTLLFCVSWAADFRAPGRNN